MAIRTENPALGKSAGLGNTSVHQGIDGFEFAQNLASAQAKFASCIMGIDPGLSGAIAFYFPDAPGRCAVEDMPVVDGQVDCATLAAHIRQMGSSFAVVEYVASRPGQGIASAFKFGASFGALRGVLAALEIRTVLVTPGAWKKHFRLDSDKVKIPRARVANIP
jgi:hypothetical protein